MGAGAISVAFVTPRDLPVVGALCLWCTSLSPSHSACSVRFHLFFNYFFLSPSSFYFPPRNLMLWIGWLGAVAGALQAGVACNGSRSLRVH